MCRWSILFTFYNISFFLLLSYLRLFLFDSFLSFTRYASSIHLYVYWLIYANIFDACLLAWLVACNVNILNTDSNKRHWTLPYIVPICFSEVRIFSLFSFHNKIFFSSSFSSHYIDCDSFSFEFTMYLLKLNEFANLMYAHTHSLTQSNFNYCVHNNTHKKAWQSSISFPFAWHTRNTVAFFRQLVIVIDVDGALHSVRNGNNSISSPFAHTSRILFCWASSW